MVSKTWRTQIHFAESIEKQQTSLYHGMFELVVDELQGRQFAYVQQSTAR